MFFEKAFPHGKKERKVIENIRSHLSLLCTACHTLEAALEKRDRNLMGEVINLENEADIKRREILSNIYDGAFLPYLRPDLCKFVEIVDSIFDFLEETAYCYLEAEIPPEMAGECLRVAFFNRQMSEMLLITFQALVDGEDLREKTLAIRIYEKKIDDIKNYLTKDLRAVPVENFWNGLYLSNFLSSLTGISDVIEDASDHLQIISVSIR